MERQLSSPRSGARSNFEMAKCPTRLVGAKDTQRSPLIEVVESSTRLIFKNKRSTYLMSDRTVECNPLLRASWQYLDSKQPKITNLSDLR